MTAQPLTHALDLVPVVGILAAGVVAVPIFRRLGLGSVLGYLAAGMLLGPFGLRVVDDPRATLEVSELGVVMFLFIIGLEMDPRRLWSLKGQIFGLGLAQVGGCGLLLTGVGILLGLTWQVAFVAGMGFVLTSTAVVIQVLEERGELATPAGQRVVSILLLEDLAIVPLLAVIAILAPGRGATSFQQHLVNVGMAAAAVAAIVAAGRWVLNPMFRFLAGSKSREVMTAAALLVVLGAALAMQAVGLSMAMGAFLAGVLLSTSSFRHQLEADVEPFRGVLLGLFFLAVGMSLDITVVLSDWQIVALSVAGYMAIKGLAIFGVARLFGADSRVAFDRAVLMAQGGEFAFVLYATAVATGLIEAPQSAVFSATVIISMMLTPLFIAVLRFILPRRRPAADAEALVNLQARVLLIGFGRFGQIAAQPLLAAGYHLSIIDNDPEMIEAADRFGQKVYFGDGRRADILRAAGAGTAEAVLVCIDDKEAASTIAALLRREFPLAKVFVRAFDRGHAIALVEVGVDFQIRETFESALVLGIEVVKALGTSQGDAVRLAEDVRDRDQRRFQLQVLDGLDAGRHLLLANADEQARERGLAADPHSA